MSTLRKHISSVRATHRLLSGDSRINDRTIAAEIKSAAFLLLKRETNLRKLWGTDTIFTTIPCLELIEVPASECCELYDGTTLARSKYKIPRIAEGNYQYLIQGVYSINALGGTGKKLLPSSPNRWLNYKNIPNKKKGEVFYFINNDYLYITDSNAKLVRISAFFEEDVSNDILFSDCNCGSSGNNVSDDEYCKNPLDRKFGLPGSLEKQVIDLTSQRLLSSYYQLKQDSTSDNIDGQAPNSKSNN